MACTCPTATPLHCTCAQWQTYFSYLRSLALPSCTCSYDPPSQSYCHKDRTPQTRNNKRRCSKLSNITESSGVTSTISSDEQRKLVDFFKTTTEHRSRVKEERKRQSRVALEQQNYETNDHLDRVGRMRRLYGEHYQQVASLEAKLSLQYETYCDENQPVLWPVLPLKL